MISNIVEPCVLRYIESPLLLPGGFGMLESIDSAYNEAEFRCHTKYSRIFDVITWMLVVDVVVDVIVMLLILLLSLLLSSSSSS